MRHGVKTSADYTKDKAQHPDPSKRCVSLVLRLLVGWFTGKLKGNPPFFVGFSRAFLQVEVHCDYFAIQISHCARSCACLSR